MLNGTKRLFPTDFVEFKEAMIESAEDGTLPAYLQLDDVRDFTLKDFQDAFYEFERDTGLSIAGSLFMCEECGRLHVMIEVDYPDEEENKLLQ